MPYVAAIDAGTTGVRAVVVDGDGTIADLAYRRLPQHFPHPGWVEHEPDDIWQSVVDTLCEVAGRLAEGGGTLAAIGITNQRETAVAWDRSNGRRLHRAIVWQDRRTAERCDRLRRDGHLSFVRERTGLVLDPYFTATKFAWLLEEGGVGRGAGTSELALATVDSWVLWQLTGGPGKGVYATEGTNASRTLLFDIDRCDWSDELCEIFGVPQPALAEVRPSCGRFGLVDGAALEARGAPAGAVGVLDGVPVSGIAGDQQAALFGQACFEEGMAKVTYGTGSFVLVNAGSERPRSADGLVTTIAWDLGGHGGEAPAGVANGGGRVTYALEGSTFVSGAAVEWLSDGLGLIERAEDIGPLAATVEDTGGVSIVPAFTGLGSPWWDPAARGTITGISRGTRREHLARAVVEAMAFGVRDMLEAMTTATGRPLLGLRADGGASAIDLLLQVQADQLGLAVRRSGCRESTALGAAMLAGLAEGIWRSLAELSDLWVAGSERSPEASRLSADSAYAGWLRAIARSRSWADG